MGHQKYEDIPDWRSWREQKYKVRPKRPVGYIRHSFCDITWIVSSRKDRRHGVVSTTKPMNTYHDKLYREMFKGWR